MPPFVSALPADWFCVYPHQPLAAPLLDLLAATAWSGRSPFAVAEFPTGKPHRVLGARRRPDNGKGSRRSLHLSVGKWSSELVLSAAGVLSGALATGRRGVAATKYRTRRINPKISRIYK